MASDSIATVVAVVIFGVALLVLAIATIDRRSL
jgi:hypothetical protein